MLRTSSQVRLPAASWETAAPELGTRPRRRFRRPTTRARGSHRTRPRWQPRHLPSRRWCLRWYLARAGHAAAGLRLPQHRLRCCLVLRRLCGPAAPYLPPPPPPCSRHFQSWPPYPGLAAVASAAVKQSRWLPHCWPPRHLPGGLPPPLRVPPRLPGPLPAPSPEPAAAPPAAVHAATQRRAPARAPPSRHMQEQVRPGRPTTTTGAAATVGAPLAARAAAAAAPAHQHHHRHHRHALPAPLGTAPASPAPCTAQHGTGVQPMEYFSRLEQSKLMN